MGFLPQIFHFWAKIRTREFFHNFPTAQNIGGQSGAVAPVPFSATMPLFNTLDRVYILISTTQHKSVPLTLVIINSAHEANYLYDGNTVTLMLCNEGYCTRRDQKGRLTTTPHTNSVLTVNSLSQSTIHILHADLRGHAGCTRVIINKSFPGFTDRYCWGTSWASSIK